MVLVSSGRLFHKCGRIYYLRILLMSGTVGYSTAAVKVILMPVFLYYRKLFHYCSGSYCILEANVLQ
jgi:hypothetical protein